MYRIYKMTKEAIRMEMTWEAIDFENEIETVAEFKTLEEAEQAYNSYDQDLHGIWSI